MKRKFITPFICMAMLSLTACTMQPTTETTVETTEVTTEEEITYDKNDNSVDALISRAITAKDSKYAVSHWGDSKCHIVIGGQQIIENKNHITTLSEDDLILDRLIDCNIGSDNICKECGYHYSKDESSLLTKAELIEAYIIANTPEPEPEPVYGFAEGKLPYIFSENLMFEVDVSQCVFNEDNTTTFKFNNYDLNLINMDSICKTPTKYLKEETNLGELKEFEDNTDFKAFCQFEDEELTKVSNVYVVRNFKKTSILYKITNPKFDVSTEDKAIENAYKEVMTLENSVDETDKPFIDFYREVAAKNTEDILLQNDFATIKLTKAFIPDYWNKISTIDTVETYIDTTEESNITVNLIKIDDKAKIVEEGSKDFVIQELENENTYVVYQNKDVFYCLTKETAESFKPPVVEETTDEKDDNKKDEKVEESTEDVIEEPTDIILFGITGFETAQEALDYYKSILQ